MPSAAGRTRCSSARAVSAGRSRCRRRGPTGASRRWRAGCRPRGWPGSTRWPARSSGSLIVMPGSGILLCDERTQERSPEPVHAAAAGAAPRGGGPARRRGAGAGRVADRAGAPVRQAGLPVRRRRAARPVCLLHPAPARPRPGAGTCRPRWPGWCAATCAGASEVEAVLAEISAINAELLARRRAAVAGDRRRAGRARAGRGGGGAGQHDHLGAGRRR